MKQLTLSSASQLSRTEFLDRKRRRLVPLRTVGVCTTPEASSSLPLPSCASPEATAARVCNRTCSCALLRRSSVSPVVPGAHLEAMDAARSMRGHNRAHRTGSESLMHSNSRTHVNTCRGWVKACSMIDRAHTAAPAASPASPVAPPTAAAAARLPEHRVRLSNRAVRATHAPAGGKRRKSQCGSERQRSHNDFDKLLANANMLANKHATASCCSKKNSPTQLATSGMRADGVMRGRAAGATTAAVDGDNGDEDDDAEWSWQAATESSTSKAGMRLNAALQPSLLAHAWRHNLTKRGCKATSDSDCETRAGAGWQPAAPKTT